MSDTLFQKITRAKLRFPTIRGPVTIEDVWEMPLTAPTGYSLDDLAKDLNRTIQQTEESFVKAQVQTNTDANTKFDAVKHIIAVRLAENEAAKNAADRKAQKAKIMEIIARKEDTALESKSLASLRKLMEEL